MSSVHEATQNFLPGPVLLLGAPGVGKGTQAQILMDSWAIPQVSTGDLIRDNIRLETKVGLRFKQLVAAGIFVPDEVVNEMVGARLAEPDAARGYVLDGYPRTLGQAEWLDRFLQNDGQVLPHVQFGTGTTQSSPRLESQPPLPVVAVSIEVRYDELLRRITGRRTSLSSKRIYNIYTNPSLVPGVCDVDGGPLMQRPDDTEEVFAERMKVFGELTAPVIEHYRRLGRFEVVDGEQSVGQVTENIFAALRRLRLGAA